jgi:hypothetical protein
LNRFYLKKPNRNRSVWLGFGFFFQKKNSVWLLFLIKTEPNRKWSPLATNQVRQTIYRRRSISRDEHISNLCAYCIGYDILVY